MRKPILAILALILASLSCGQYVTPTPPPASRTDTAIPSPQPATETAIMETSTPEPEAINTAQVVKTSIHIRLNPDGAAVGTLREGDTVQVIECQDGWCKIQLYVWQGCLSENPDSLGCQAR